MRSLDHYAPKWAVGRIINKACRCGNRFQRRDIMQIGIRKVDRGNTSVEALAIEVLCPVCEKISVSTFSKNTDLRQLLCMLLEEIQKTERLEKLIKKERANTAPKITDREVADFKRKLKKIKKHSDFLKELGMDET